MSNTEENNKSSLFKYPAQFMIKNKHTNLKLLYFDICTECIDVVTIKGSHHSFIV